MDEDKPEEETVETLNPQNKIKSISYAHVNKMKQVTSQLNMNLFYMQREIFYSIDTTLNWCRDK